MIHYILALLNGSDTEILTLSSVNIRILAILTQFDLDGRVALLAADSALTNSLVCEPEFENLPLWFLNSDCSI